uniref:HATPase_c domain-containing protein n=1 Tax=Caenorhabditis tropicalis TaxID=1561998 RepID=A0A1I7T6Z2_9PELO
MVQSMWLIKHSEQRKDYNEKLIVEGVEKRRTDLYLMISDLITEICYDDKDVKVNLTIKDETGHPKTMRGAGVEAGVNRVLEMTTDGNSINLSTSNTSLARINVPRHKNHHSHRGHHKNHHTTEVEISKYNKCSKQEKILSPRKILK